MMELEIYKVLSIALFSFGAAVGFRAGWKLANGEPIKAITPHLKTLAFLAIWEFLLAQIVMWRFL